MKNSDVDETSLARGLYCWKKSSGCFCRVGPRNCNVPSAEEWRKGIHTVYGLHQTGNCGYSRKTVGISSETYGLNLD